MPTLSEAASTALVARYGLPVLSETTAPDVRGAVEAADALGYPVVVKLCGPAITHKTERGLVRLDLVDPIATEAASRELLARARPEDGPVELLVAPYARGTRELIAGLHRDERFGPCVMLGLGGILAEAMADVVFRLAPLTRVDAQEMIVDLGHERFLGEFRGEPAIDREGLTDLVCGLADLAQGETNVVSVDLNPVLIVDGRPVVVDALVEI